MNILLRMFLSESIDQVNFSADSPLGACRLLSNDVNDFCRRSRRISRFENILWTFRVNQNFYSGKLFSKLCNVRGGKHLMDTAVPFPKKYAALS